MRQRAWRAQLRGHAGHLRGWIGPPGRGPAGLPVGRAWQAAEPCIVAVDRIRPGTMRLILNRFQLI
jgi:hypothetical protein